jgi:hypothetical protein
MDPAQKALLIRAEQALLPIAEKPFTPKAFMFCFLEFEKSMV